MKNRLITGFAAAVLELSTGVALAQTAGYGGHIAGFDGQMSRGHALDTGLLSGYTATAPDAVMAPAPQATPPTAPAADSAQSKKVDVPPMFYKAQGVEVH